MEDPNDSRPTKQDVTQWLTEHGDVLFRYAVKRVGAQDVAEDLVQDTFLAALRSAADFEGRSKVQTWLIGILRHKISDHMRRLSRQRPREVESEEELTPFQHGHWKVGLKQWPVDPTEPLETKEFWQVLQECQAKLPAKLAMAFRMRDLEQLTMADICDTLEISASNLSVRLHRARILLRECLDQNWFSIGRQP